MPNATNCAAPAAGEGPYVKSSGTKRVYSTGAQRDGRAGKGRYDLISPIFLRRLAFRLEGGVPRYGARNWEKGIPLADLYDSTVRHLMQWMANDASEDHLGAAAFGIMAMIHTEEKVLDGELPEALLFGDEQMAGLPTVMYPSLDETMNKLAANAYDRGERAGRRKPNCPGSGPMWIYVAGPYSRIDGEIATTEGKEENVRRAVAVGAALAAKGHFPHVPHSATHPIDQVLLSKNIALTHDYWLELDKHLIRNAMDALYRFPGASAGADEEVALAHELGLPVYYSLDEVPDALAASPNPLRECDPVLASAAGC